MRVRIFTMCGLAAQRRYLSGTPDNVILTGNPTEADIFTDEDTYLQAKVYAEAIYHPWKFAAEEATPEPATFTGAESLIIADLAAEVRRARAKFPNTADCILAWAEEVAEACAELRKEYIHESEPAPGLRQELIQVMCMSLCLLTEDVSISPELMAATQAALYDMENAGDRAKEALEAHRAQNPEINPIG